MSDEIFYETHRSFNFDEGGNKSYVRKFRVGNTSNSGYPNEVVSLIGIVYDDPYPDDATALCRSVSADLVELSEWDVTYNYSSKQTKSDRGTVKPNDPSSPPDSKNTNSNQTAPESRPWVFTWDSVQVDEVQTEDKSVDEEGEPDPKEFVNAAGLPFDPPPTLPSSRGKLSIKFYRSSLNPTYPLLYNNAVNSETMFSIWEAGTVRCTKYTETTQYENSNFFVEAHVEFEFKPDGWNPIRIANVSTHVKESMTKPYTQIHDRKTGQAVTTPVPISADGTRPLNADEAIIYLEFTGYSSIPLLGVFS